MKQSKHLLSLTTFLLLFALSVPQSFADISSAALLYLRIAPGARAAGMGEAFVAVADDATSTHWNPAGLGASPLATNWQNKNIPVNLQPISEMATVKARGGSGHNHFDIWTISAEGLARFVTKTDQNVADIVRNYFSIVDDNELETAVAKVARANSNISKEELDTFLGQIRTSIPEGYTDKESLERGLDSLSILYSRCRIAWSRYDELVNIYKDGNKDSTFTEKEMDRVNFAVEKSKSRFIPEELKIKYSDLFSGNLTTIKSLGNKLLIGTDNGFYTFDGKSWKSYALDDGLPSMNILSIATVGSQAYIGTDMGMVRYGGVSLSAVDLPESYQGATVSGLGASNSNSVWAVINGELFHYNGESWNNSHAYTALIDDTYESIAQKISIFQKKSVIDDIAARIKSLNENLAMPTEEAMIEDTSAIEAPAETTESMAGDSSMTAEVEETAPEMAGTHVPTNFTIEPGKPIMVPYGMGIQGKINKIYSMGDNRIWIATDIGLYAYKDGIWKAAGYKTIKTTAGQSLEDVANAYPHPSVITEDYITILSQINEISDASALAEGTELRVYGNPLAYKINDISSKGYGLYVATQKGLYELSGTTLTKVDIGGMGNSNILNVNLQDDEIWFASDKKIAIKASGRSDIVLMFAKWLPQLADDMYYGFLSGATNISGFGTVGANITYINYGTVNRRSEGNTDEGAFYPFDIALTLSYGGSLRDNLKGGVSVKLIYSHLSRLGAGEEQGTGTATGAGFDFGLLWNLNKRFDVGMAITNIGPDISYIDAGQSDPLPRNFALGFKADVVSSEYYHTMITAEVNKSLVGINDGFKEELKQLILNGGIEFGYSDIFAARVGYIWDDEGDVKTPTLGFGVSPLDNFKFDFAYIPSNTNAPLANTLRISMQILP